MDTQLRVTELTIDIISPPNNVRNEILALHKLVEKWIMHEGLQGIKRCKSLFDYALDCFLGQPVTSPSWVKKSKYGYPSLIMHTLQWGESKPKEALTLLRIHELYSDTLTDEKCKAAMESITDPSNAVNTQEYIDAILEEAAELSVDRLKVDVATVPMFSNGPNGLAILSVHKDARAHHRYGTVEKILKFSDSVAAQGIGVKSSDSMTDMLLSFSDYSDEELGRLVFLPEKAGKLRVIATGDYITQTTLKPIHDSINGILRKIQGDFTFDQEAGKRWMINQTGIQKWMSSYDLSSATDRLPAWLQAKIIDAALPGNLGNQWLDILTSRQFKVTLPSGKTEYVKYSVGQPMGYYSSFAAFALLHHCVVRASYKLAHKRELPKHQFYAIIGDDMVITDKLSGDMYCKIITDIGGVVNLDKSRISTTPGVTIAEFAKAWSVNGKDITPSSLRLIRSGLKSPMSVPQMVNTIQDKLGWPIRAKKLKFILQKYWPKEANTLIGLIPVPQKLGGFGKPDSNPLLAAIHGPKGNALRLFLAEKVYSSFRKVIRISADALEKLDDDSLDPVQTRKSMFAFTKLLRDREAEIGFDLVNHSRKQFISWVLSKETPISLLLDWFASMTANIPVSIRETLPPDSLSWVKALEDDQRLSSQGPSNSELELQLAGLELVTSIAKK